MPLFRNKTSYPSQFFSSPLEEHYIPILIKSAYTTLQIQYCFIYILDNDQNLVGQ